MELDWATTVAGIRFSVVRIPQGYRMFVLGISTGASFHNPIPLSCSFWWRYRIIRHWMFRRIVCEFLACYREACKLEGQ